MLHNDLSSRNAGVQDLKVLKVAERMARLRASQKAEKKSGGGSSEVATIDPHGRRAARAYLDALTGGKWGPIIKTETLSLLTVDSEIFLPTIQRLLICEKPWTVAVGPKGVEFMGLPVIPRMHTMKMDFRNEWGAGFEVFGESEGLVRFADLRVLTVDLYAPDAGNRDAVLSMVRNLQGLVDILERRQKLKGDKEPLMTLRVHLNVAEKDRKPGDYAKYSLMVKGGPRPRRWEVESSYFSSCAWFDRLWDEDVGQYRQVPSTCFFTGTWTIDLVTIPFRRLRNVSNVQLILPPSLNLWPHVRAFKEQFETELRGSTPIDLERELKLQTFHDALDDHAYDRFKKMHKDPAVYNSILYGIRQPDQMLDMYSSIGNIKIDTSFHLPHGLEADERGRLTQAEKYFGERWQTSLAAVNGLYVRGSMSS